MGLKSERFFASFSLLIFSSLFTLSVESSYGSQEEEAAEAVVLVSFVSLSRGRAAVPVGGDWEAWLWPMAESVWGLGLVVGNWVAGVGFAKSSRKMGSPGREALTVVGRGTP